MGRKRKIHQSSTTSSEDQAFGEGEDNYLDDLPQQKYVNHNQDEISEEGDDDETKGNYEGDQDVRREQEEEEEEQEQESDNAQQEEENDDGEEEEENEDEHQQLNENSQVSKGAAALSDEQENNLSKKQINNQIEKKRKKVKKSQIIYGGRAPSPQYTRLAEIIMPDKYELYLSQVGGISRSNTLSSQSTQPIYSLTLSKQNSHQSASSTSEPKQQQLKQQQSKAQKKAAQKRKEKNAQNMDSTIHHDNEDEVKQKRKKSGKEDEMNEQMDEESSASGSQCQNKANAENQSIKNKFDTKNLVKNFLNQFLTFVHSEEEEKQVREIINMEDGSKFTEYKNLMKLFFKNKKFNRALLKEFVFVVDYRRLFLFFLQNRANDWIMQGRMKDKASHLRALQNFIYICENFSQIKSWRFRYNFV